MTDVCAKKCNVFCATFVEITHCDSTVVVNI